MGGSIMHSVRLSGSLGLATTIGSLGIASYTRWKERVVVEREPWAVEKWLKSVDWLDWLPIYEMSPEEQYAHQQKKEFEKTERFGGNLFRGTKEGDAQGQGN